VGTLTYEITFPLASAVSNTTGVFTGLLPGTYIFKVTDVNGCYYTQSHYVLPVTLIAVSGNVSSDVLCKGGNTGATVFTVSGYSGTYTSSLTNGTGTLVQSGNTVNLTNLIAGSYTVQVTDNATGCTASTSVTITEPTDALTFTANATNVNCNNDNSQITVTASGGTQNYTYAAVITGAAAPTTYSSSNIITVDTNSGTNLSWDVYVKDANGCVTNNTLLPTIVTLDPMPTVTTTPLPTDQCTSNGSSYSFTAAGTGVALLTYSIGGSFQASSTFTVTATGLYTITVKDGNGCMATTAITVYPVLTAAAVLTADLDCIAPTDATIRIDASGGKAPYTYLVSVNGGAYSSAGISGNVFTANSAGTFLFEVTDANGCKRVSNPITINPKVNPDITLLDQTQDIYCNGEATASITVSIDTSKGIGPFTYSIDGLTFQTSNVFSGLVAGTYTVTVKDSKGCTDTETIIINQPDALNYALTKTDLLCSGPPPAITLGSVTVDVATGLGGTAPYTYILTNNVGDPTQTVTNNPGTNHTFTGLNYGTYAVTVVDANGCTLKQNIPVTSPPDDLVISVQTTATCAAGGTVEVTAGGALLGNGPFYFAIYQKDAVSGLYPGAPIVTAGVPDPPYIAEDVPGAPYTATFTGLTQGVIYSFIVYDSATGCSYIKQASAPTIKATSLSTLRVVTDVTCKGAGDGTVSITLDKDPSAPVGDLPPTTIDYVVYNSQTNLPISPTNDGYGISVGTYPFTMPLIGGLSPGSYYVVITEHGGTYDGCSSATLPFDIYESATDLIVVATIVKNANCNANAGQIVAIAQGGTTVSREDPLAVPPQVSAPVPYQYQILPDTGTIGDASDDVPPTASDVNWNTSNTFMKDSGNYIVYAMDANKCIKPYPITLSLDPSPAITLSVVDQCAVEDAFEIVVNEATAGVAPYSISVNGSAYQNFSFVSGTPNSYTISNLNSGTYNISVQDVNGCIDTESITLYKKVSANSVLNKEWTCTTGDANALITTNISDGQGVFSYKVNINGGGYGLPTNVVGNSFTYSPAPLATATTYQFEITDGNGCIVETNVITIEPIENPIATTIVTNATCSGTSNGSVTIIPSLGVPPYTYSFNGSGTFTSTVTYGGLAGSVLGTAYNYQVKDSYDCIFNGTATVFEPTPVAGTIDLTQGLTCGAGNASQAATVTVTATPGTGTAPYYYSFNGGASYSSNNVYTTNVAGNVNAFIKDGNGCVIATPLTVNIPALNPPTDLDFVSTAVTCVALTSDVTLTTTNGTGTLSYAILFPSGATSNVSGASSGIFTGLLPGTYLFQVTDANFCTYQESYTVAPVTSITVSGQLISDVTCNPGFNGEVRFTVANFAGNYMYSINGGAVSAPQSSPTITVSGLSAASTQTINITDVITGCTATASVTVAQPAPLALVANPFINANCNFGAQVSVTASGGVAPYSYSYVPSGNPAGTYSASASAVLDPATATSWDVYVKDANGCVITTPLAITIATDPLPTVAVNPYSQCPSGTGTYTFTVAATGMAPFEYSIGAGFQTNPSFTVNAAGTYDVTVKDKNGCTTTISGLVNILPALQLQATITALPTCVDGDGTLTLIATGGSGTYEYSLDAGTYQLSANFTNIFAGTHTLTVRDVTTNCTKAIPVNLGAATPITGFALSKTDVSCNGGSNGVITATMATPAPGVNDNPVYNYSLSGTVSRPTQLSNIFSGLPTGNYTVTVTSARGCVATQAITVNEPAIITVPAPTVSPFGCNAGSNATNFATITVTGVTGGSGVYSYEFIKGGTRVQFGTNNVYTEANLLGGTYTVNVYDSKGCVGTAPATIPIVPFIALDKINIAVNNAITCTNLEDITVSVSSIGGTPTNLQYTVVDYNATTGVSGALYPSQTNATGVFTGLPVANYLITVTNLDTGCSVKSVHYVNEPNTFDLTINGVTDVTCYGGTNGSVNVTLIDRVITATNPNQAGPFSYTVVDTLGNPITSDTSATAGPLTINALAAGTYTIVATLTNSPFCTVSKNFTITQPVAALAIAETHTAITCISGNNDGSVSATATGGWPGGYQYELIGPVTVAYSAQRTFVNLTAGTYTVNVRDSKGCVATTNVTLSIPTPIVFTATPNTTLLGCFGNKTAAITVNLPSGGQGSNYMYTLNTTSLTPATASGPQASPVFSGLGAGTYTITVTDGYSCSATSAPIVIAQPTRVTTNLMVAATQTCLTQTRLTLSANGGTGTYTYSADVAFTTVLGSFATSTTFPVPVGTYVYYVKDANGCVGVVSNQIKIDPLPTLTINLDKTNAVINCAGDNTGVIVATAQGGLGNYSYTLLNGSGAIVQGPTASGNFTALFAGNYQVKVDSGDCTTLSSMISITQPAAPLTTTYVIQEVSCNGANNGVFTVNASGGTGIIKYAISPNLNQFFDTNIFDKLAPGNYDVIVQDVLGCYVKINFDITEPAPIIASTIPGTILPEICFGDKDGAFMIDVTGGVLPYSVSLDNPNGTYTTGAATQTQFDFTGLTGGSHTVYIRDAKGCGVEWVVVLPESVKINPIAAIDYRCLNNAANNTVTVTVDASITNPADLDYSLDGAPYQLSNVFTNVVPGTNHYIDVRHTNGCIQRTDNFEILQVDPLALVLNDGGLNEIVATATGGGGGYQYTFNGESNGTKNTFIIYKSGNYTVEVTDVNGCVASATRYFEYIDVCIPNYFTPNGDGISDGWAPGCTVNYKDLTFDIFDRYGRKIATYRLGEYWNGKYNGQELPSGDYWYVLRLNDSKDNREFVGHFTLYR
jgi:large repetitive protein